jgi:hypothetical protein
VHDFCEANRWHWPVIHHPTFSVEDKPVELIHAMHVAGANFSKTRVAKRFVNDHWASTINTLLETIVSFALCCTACVTLNSIPSGQF